MTKTERGEDQSMEEILSSIRKIASQQAAGPTASTDSTPQDPWNSSEASPATGKRPTFGFSRSMPSSKAILGENDDAKSQADAAHTTSELTSGKPDTLNGRSTGPLPKTFGSEPTKDSTLSTKPHSNDKATQGLASALDEINEAQNGGSSEPTLKTSSFSASDDLSDLLSKPEPTPVSSALRGDKFEAQKTTSILDGPVDESEAKADDDETEDPIKGAEQRLDDKLDPKADVAASDDKNSSTTSSSYLDDNTSDADENVSQIEATTVASEESSSVGVSNATTTNTSAATKDSFPRIARKSGGFYPPSDRAKVPSRPQKEKSDSKEDTLDDILTATASQPSTSKIGLEDTSAAIATQTDTEKTEAPVPKTSETSAAEASPLDALAAGIAASSAKMATTPATESAQMSDAASSTSITTASSAEHLVGQPRTLEDVVTEMLRPMLREWLEANMPRIVENALRIEVSESSGATKDDRTL